MRREIQAVAVTEACPAAEAAEATSWPPGGLLSSPSGASCGAANGGSLAADGLAPGCFSAAPLIGQMGALPAQMSVPTSACHRSEYQLAAAGPDSRAGACQRGSKDGTVPYRMTPTGYGRKSFSAHLLRTVLAPGYG